MIPRFLPWPEWPALAISCAVEAITGAVEAVVVPFIAWAASVRASGNVYGKARLKVVSFTGDKLTTFPDETFVIVVTDAHLAGRVVIARAALHGAPGRWKVRELVAFADAPVVIVVTEPLLAWGIGIAGTVLHRAPRGWEVGELATFADAMFVIIVAEPLLTRRSGVAGAVLHGAPGGWDLGERELLFVGLFFLVAFRRR